MERLHGAIAVSIPLDLLAYICRQDDDEARRLCRRHAGNLADVVAGRRRWVFTRDENTAKLAKELGLKVYNACKMSETEGYWIGRGEYNAEDVVDAALYAAGLTYKALVVFDDEIKPGPLAAAGSRYREPPAPPITPFCIGVPNSFAYVHTLSLVVACILSELRLPAVVLAPTTPMKATGPVVIIEAHERSAEWAKNVEELLLDLGTLIGYLVYQYEEMTYEEVYKLMKETASRLKPQLGGRYAVFIVGDVIDVLPVQYVNSTIIARTEPKKRTCIIGADETGAKLEVAASEILPLLHKKLGYHQAAGREASTPEDR